ncbi:MAG: hypothetical protein RDV48_10235 [Candidatus Eremiobacteraeota bacterium]|nr:hypothetical protein [Candidatus Eremiobacteraeota bacterium]
MRQSVSAFLRRELPYATVLFLLLIAAFSLRLIPFFPRNILIFDEAYYTPVKDIPELQRSLPHPPVALYLIKWCGKVWGPYGWRAGGALTGTACLFLFSLVARRFLPPAFSLLATWFLCLDFLNFTLCRLGMLDIYAFFLCCWRSCFFSGERIIQGSRGFCGFPWESHGVLPWGANGAACFLFSPACHSVSGG